MDWLSQNWLWMVFGVGALFFFFLAGFSGRGASRNGAGAMFGGVGCGASGGLGDEAERPADGAAAPGAAIDPVGGAPVRANQALTSLHQGKICYFASKDNRDRFEGAPQDDAQEAAGRWSSREGASIAPAGVAAPERVAGERRALADEQLPLHRPDGLLRRARP